MGVSVAKYEYDKKVKIYRTPSGQRMTVDMVLGVLNGKWGHALHKINVTGPGILSIKRPKQQSEEDFTESLRELSDDVLGYLRMSMVLIGVENHGDIQYLDEEKMNWHGWMLREKCHMTAEEADKYIEDYHGEEE